MQSKRKHTRNPNNKIIDEKQELDENPQIWNPRNPNLAKSSNCVLLSVVEMKVMKILVKKAVGSRRKRWVVAESRECEERESEWVREEFRKFEKSEEWSERRVAYLTKIT